jgi:hypothetical protein
MHNIPFNLFRGTSSCHLQFPWKVKKCPFNKKHDKIIDIISGLYKISNSGFNPSIDVKNVINLKLEKILDLCIRDIFNDSIYFTDSIGLALSYARNTCGSQLIDNFEKIYKCLDENNSLINTDEANILLINIKSLLDWAKDIYDSKHQVVVMLKPSFIEYCIQNSLATLHVHNNTSGITTIDVAIHTDIEEKDIWDIFIM